jgi:hypothetical protein
VSLENTIKIFTLFVKSVRNRKGKEVKVNGGTGSGLAITHLSSSVKGAKKEDTHHFIDITCQSPLALSLT